MNLLCPVGKGGGEGSARAGAIPCSTSPLSRTTLQEKMRLSFVQNKSCAFCGAEEDRYHVLKAYQTVGSSCVVHVGCSLGGSIHHSTSCMYSLSDGCIRRSSKIGHAD